MERLHKFRELQRFVDFLSLNREQILKFLFILQLHTQSDGTTVHTVQMDGHNEQMQLDLSEALGQDGQLIIQNEDGNGENLIKVTESLSNLIRNLMKIFLESLFKPSESLMLKI